MRKGIRVMKPLETKEYASPSVREGKYWKIGKQTGFNWELYGKDFEQFIKDLTEDLTLLKKLILEDTDRNNELEKFGCNQNCDITIIDYVLEKLNHED